MAGRRSIDETNKIRASLGLSVVPKKERKSNAILPNEKKARHQQILAELIGKKSKAVVQRVIDKALNPEDPDQMACLKLIMDRVIPTSYFEKEKTGNNGVTIQIMGVETKINDTVDAEFVEVDG